MGRRKKKLEFEKIHPLESVTIGVIKPPKFVLLKTFILIGIFGTVVYFLPEVKTILDGNLLPLLGIAPADTDTKPTNTTTNTTPGPDEPKEDPVVVDPDIHSFADTTDVDLLDKYYISLTNISLDENNVLSFNINTTKLEYNVDSGKLFFIVYNDDGVALAYYRLTGLVKKDVPLSKMFNTKPGTKFAVKYLDSESYPIHDMLFDSDNNAEAVCTKANDEYKYYFKDSFLNKVEYKTSFSEDAANYSELKDTYTKIKLNYDGVTGYTASYDVKDGVTTFKLSVDYVTATKTIDTGKFYYKDAKYNDVLFELEAEQYNCEIIDLTKKKTN